MHLDALGDQRAQVFGRHVLVVERDDLAALRERAQRVEVGVRAEHHVPRDQSGGVVLGDGEHAK